MQKQCYHYYDNAFFLVSPFLWMFNFLTALGDRLIISQIIHIHMFIDLFEELQEFSEAGLPFTEATLAFPKYQSNLSRRPLIFTSLQLLCCTPQTFLSIPFAILRFSVIRGILSERFKTIFNPSLTVCSVFCTSTLPQ